MRRILHIIAAFLLIFYPAEGYSQILSGILGGTPLAASVTWTLVQHPWNASTCGTSSCVVTLSQNTGSGNLLVILVDFYGTGTSFAITGINAGGSLVHPAGCAKSDATNKIGTDCGYVLSSTSGVSAITVSYSGTPSNGDSTAEVLEYSRSSGTATFDNANNTAGSASSNLAAAPSLSISGTNDVFVQTIQAASTVPTAISGSYSHPADINKNSNGGGVAGAINQNSYSAPNWTTDANQPYTASVVAFY